MALGCKEEGKAALCHYDSSEIVDPGNLHQLSTHKWLCSAFLSLVVREHAWILRLASRRTIQQHMPLCCFQRKDMGAWDHGLFQLKTELSLPGCDPISYKAIHCNWFRRVDSGDTWMELDSLAVRSGKEMTMRFKQIQAPGSLIGLDTFIFCYWIDSGPVGSYWKIDCNKLALRRPLRGSKPLLDHLGEMMPQKHWHVLVFNSHRPTLCFFPVWWL